MGVHAPLLVPDVSVILRNDLLRALRYITLASGVF